jgi:hypothetical protein
MTCEDDWGGVTSVVGKECLMIGGCRLNVAVRDEQPILHESTNPCITRPVGTQGVKNQTWQ